MGSFEFELLDGLYVIGAAPLSSSLLNRFFLRLAIDGAASIRHKRYADRVMSDPNNDFEALSRQSRGGFLSDVWDLLRHSKRWWLTPIVFILVLFGAILALGASGAAPFLYTLF